MDDYVGKYRNAEVDVMVRNDPGEKKVENL